MTRLILELAIALVFSGGCAIAYRFLARGRQNVRREAVWVFLSLLLFSAVRFLLGGLP